MSGPHDFAVRGQRPSSSDVPRPSHPASRFVTIAHTPLLPGRDGGESEVCRVAAASGQGCGKLARRAICAWRICEGWPSGEDSVKGCRADSRASIALAADSECRWVTGTGPALQASRASYGAVLERASRGWLGGRAVVPHTDGVTESRDEPRSKHRGETTVDYYAGIDVSLECSSVCVVGTNGKIIREARICCSGDWKGEKGVSSCNFPP